MGGSMSEVAEHRDWDHYRSDSMGIYGGREGSFYWNLRAMEFCNGTVLQWKSAMEVRHA